MGIVIVVLAVALVFLTFRYIRQRIEDRKNEELNQQARKVYKKVERSIKVAPPTYTAPDVPDIVNSIYFIGDIEQWDKPFKDGYYGLLKGEEYIYANGIWHKMEYYLPKMY